MATSNLEKQLPKAMEKQKISADEPLSARATRIIEDSRERNRVFVHQKFLGLQNLPLDSTQTMPPQSPNQDSSPQEP